MEKGRWVGETQNNSNPKMVAVCNYLPGKERCAIVTWFLFL